MIYYRMLFSLKGTSPEFEIALYTMCFLIGIENPRVDCGPYHLEVEWHK